MGRELKENLSMSCHRLQPTARKSGRGLLCTGAASNEVHLSLQLLQEPETLSSTQGRVGDRNKETELPE